MHHCGRAATGLASAALALCGAAATAHAGTASGRPAQFTAAAAERNDLTVDAGAGGAVRFSDAGAPIVAALPWCTPFPVGQALCDPDEDPRDTDGGGVNVDLADGDDRALVKQIPGTDTRPGAIRVAAGSGDDRVENLATGVVRLEGGDGDDALLSGPAATAFVLGGAGGDLLQSQSACCAIAGYGDHDRSGVRVTLDGIANDGANGEGDDVRTTGVAGSPGPDVVSGDSGPNSLTGAAGADMLAGAAGDDAIDATDGADAADSVTCGTGSDDVAADADDRVAVDCERIRVGRPAVPELVLDAGAGRAGRSGTVTVTYRVRFPNPDNALASRSTFRLVDREGRAASSTAGFVLGRDATVARVRVKLRRETRSRLARARSGAIALVAQRVSRSADAASPDTGYEQFNARVRIRRAGRTQRLS